MVIVFLSPGFIFILLFLLVVVGYEVYNFIARILLSLTFGIVGVGLPVLAVLITGFLVFIHNNDAIKKISKNRKFMDVLFFIILIISAIYVGFIPQMFRFLYYYRGGFSNSEIYRNAIIVGLIASLCVTLLIVGIQLVRTIKSSSTKNFISLLFIIVLLGGMIISIIIPVNRAIYNSSPARYNSINMHQNSTTHTITQDTFLYLRVRYQVPRFGSTRRQSMYFPNVLLFPRIPVARLPENLEFITFGNVLDGKIEIAVNERLAGVVRVEHTSLGQERLQQQEERNQLQEERELMAQEMGFDFFLAFGDRYNLVARLATGEWFSAENSDMIGIIDNYNNWIVPLTANHCFIHNYRIREITGINTRQLSRTQRITMSYRYGGYNTFEHTRFAPGAQHGTVELVVVRTHNVYDCECLQN